MSVPARRDAVDIEVLPFVCDDCGKAFVNIQGLSGHKLVHRSVDPCPECGEAFTTPSAQARHRAKEHGVPLKGKYVKKADRGIPPDELTADDLLETVIGVMFPTGVLPNKAVMPLIIWREATKQLIDALQTQTQI